MYAKQNIKKGSILLKEQPFVYILNSAIRTQHCDSCFKKGDLLKCSNCHYVYYCGKECQREGWPLHKGECNSLKRIAPRMVPDAARLLARLIQKLNKGGNSNRSYYMRDRFRTFKDLMSHYGDLKTDERRLEHFTALCSVLKEFLSDAIMPNSVELLGMYGRMCINSFNIIDSEMKTLGTGIYLAASILDHSCEPTAVATFIGTTLYIRSLCDMKCLDWNKVYISYIDVLNSPKERQNELEKQYYFLCQCPKCIDDTVLGIMNAAVCQNVDCGGYINMNNVDINDLVKCGKCNTQLEKEFITDLDVCKICLEKSQGILYKLNIQHVKLLDSSFECSIDLEQWNDAKNFGTQLLEGYLFYYNDLSPLLGLLYMKLSKIHLLFNEEKEAKKNEIRPLMEQLACERNMNGF
ncbi:putative MYND finger protein [Trypoxylus dichotomus]